MSPIKRSFVLFLVILLAAGGAWGFYVVRLRDSAPKYRLARVERGPLVAVVSATGTLNAVVTVQVGSQVSGQIKALYADFNSQVKKNQLVALIDPDIFEAQVKQAQGDLEAARAAVLNQEAQVVKTRSDLLNARAALAQSKANVAKADVGIVDTKRNLGRMRELRGRDLVAQSDEDTAQVNYDSAVAQRDAMVAQEHAAAAAVQSAEAQLKVAEAQLASARAQVMLKTAALRQAELNLEHTRILAPVEGVVVARNVDVGQTVAASLQAPTLFLIAQDLTRMQVDTNVDEADVGRVRLDQAAPFTVDAFPGHVFQGRVTQIRKAPQVVQNVVTYDVVVEAPNPDLRLLPGMTANVRITVDQKEHALKVPNTALRFRPAGVDAPSAGAGRVGPAPGAPSAGTGGAGSAAASMESLRARLVQNLTLTEEQQKTLDAILDDSRRQFRALQGLAEPERRAEAQKVRETTRARIRAILTPDQQARYDALAAGAAGPSRGAASSRVWIVDAKGNLAPVPLALGITDGTATEVLQGGLKEGQEVVVGTGPASGRGPGASPTGPRLRL